MAEHPYLPLWTDAYLGDTTHLTTIEHGAYLLLLMVMWRSKSGSLPNDDKILARYTKTTTAQWRRLKPVIMEFFDERDGQLVQGRLSDERKAVRQKSKSASDSAKARWLKNKESDSANASETHSERNATTPTPTTNKKNNNKKGCQIQNCTTPKEDFISYSEDKYSHVDSEREYSKFVDHWLSKGETRKDWLATWRNWLANGYNPALKAQAKGRVSNVR